MFLRRHAAAPVAALILTMAAPAAAQMSGAALVGPLDRGASPPVYRPHAPDFRMPEGDLRYPGEPRRNGLIAAVAVNRNLDIGIGRFRIAEPARPRTYMETDRQPASVRGRERGMAGFGFSLRFD
jgi:hypothetical protein